MISMSRVNCVHTTHRIEHAHDFHELFFSLNGAGHQFINGDVYTMKSGDTFLFPPGMSHLCSATKPRTHAESFVVWVHESLFSGDSPGDQETRGSLDNLTQLVRQSSPLLKLSPPTIVAIKNVFKGGELFFPSNQGGSAGGMKSVVQFVLHSLSEDPLIKPLMSSSREIGPSENRVGPVLQYIEQNYMRPITVEEICHVIHVSRSHFHTLFRQSAGMTFVEYLIRFRVKVAARLLKETSMSILDIADACGFPSLGHFYQCFQKIKGQTPRRYRAEPSSPQDSGIIF